MQESVLNPPVEAGVTVSRPALAWVGRLAAFALGVVLLVAAGAKALDPAAFAEALASRGLTFGLPPLAVVMAVLAVEIGLGLLLLLDVRRVWTLSAATVLVVSFVVLNGWDWWQAAHGAARAAGCGCFGNLVQRTPAQAFWQDLAMLAPALLLAWVGLPRAARAFPPRRTAGAVVGVVAVLLFAWRAPELPLDDVATRLRPGVELAKVCAGTDEPVCLTDVVPELSEGRSWVVLVDLASAEQWADELNRIAGRPGSPPVVALASASLEAKSAFTWQWGPTFPVRDAPPALFRPLYRRLPRSFLSEGGRVLLTVPGLPAGDVRGESPR
jgi:hypothetical protein